MRRILLSILVIAAVAGATIKLSSAFFSDTETSTENTFTAGKVDLRVGNDSYYNGTESALTSWLLEDDSIGKFFDFQDLKPSDWGEDTISIQIDDNDAWACMDVNITSDDDNDCTEPESIDDLACVADNDDEFDGEVGGLVQFIFWVDDGDNVIENDEYPNKVFLSQDTATNMLTDLSVVLADATENLFTGIPGTPLTGLETYHIGKAWCFGEMTVTPVIQGNGNSPTLNPGFTCDGSGINNAPQSDSLTADIIFRAEQARHNANFLCSPVVCTEETVMANSVEASNQGDRKDASNVLAARSDPTSALGTPDGTSTTGFFSLGFGGTITIEFADIVGDGAGDDIAIHEITNGRASYPMEQAKVEVSLNGTNWFEIGTATSKPNAVSMLDISDAPGAPSQIKFVRLTDTSDPNIHTSDADGFDLDAVGAVYGACTTQ